MASARGSDLEVSYAWGVVRQLFEPRLRGMSAGTRSRTLAGAAALAGPVVLPDAAPPRDPDASFGVLHGLYWLVAALAEQRPQLLVVDDLHWADGASVRFLEFLANRLDALPVLLLGGGADGRRAPSRRRSSHRSGSRRCRRPRRRQCSPSATAARSPRRSSRACHGATGGNPLLIRRLADGLHDAARAGDAEVA